MSEPFIYIVDDDEAVRDSLTLLLQFKGFRCQSFPSAEALLASWQTDWRGCLLVDLHMPGMDGLALQQALAEAGCSLPIIFLTGHGNVAHARTALKGGATDFLEKPVDEVALLQAVSEALDQESRQHLSGQRNAELQSRLTRLTERERQVLDLVIAGKPNREIAVLLEISPRTVEVFKSRMMEKMQARSTPELVRMYLESTVTEIP